MFVLKSDVLRVVEVLKKSKAEMIRNLQVGDKIQMTVKSSPSGSGRSLYATYIKVTNLQTNEYTHLSFNQLRLLYNAVTLTEVTSCEWCKEDFRYMQGGVEKRRFAEDDDTDYVDIECWGYCPVCGRKLKEGDEQHETK